MTPLPAGWTSGEERTITTVCSQCPGGCGLSVRVVEGRAVKIEGNPDHPMNEGGTCPKGQAGLQVLYDPDRIPGPLKRARGRGTGRWERIGWEEALDTVGKGLRTLRGEKGGHSLVFMTGRRYGSMDEVVRRFLRAYGSPNYICHTAFGRDALRLAHGLVLGTRELPVVDWDNLRYVVSFGANLLESSQPTTRILRAFSHMRRGHVGARPKIVHIDPRFSVTGAKADAWIPIKPGSDAVLALAMAHVIVREELHDKAFVRDRCFGFHEWTDGDGGKHPGFKDLLLKEYPPERAEHHCGIEAKKIAELAREFARVRPSVAVAGRGAAVRSNGVYNAMAVHCLNALVGSVGAKGGVGVQMEPPLSALPPLPPDPVAKDGLRKARIDGAGSEEYPLSENAYSRVAEALEIGDPYPAEALFLYYTNPAFSNPQPDRFARAIEKVPLVVSFSPFMDDTSKYADLILPDHTYLERWEDNVPVPGPGFPLCSIRKPVVEPLHDTRNTADVLFALARRIGGSLSKALPWRSMDPFLRFRAEGLRAADSKSGSKIDKRTFWKSLITKGFWSDEAKSPWGKAPVIATPSGKFEFFSQALKAGLEQAFPAGDGKTPTMEEKLSGLGIAARGDEVYMPHYEAPRWRGDEREGTFVLNTFKTMTHAGSRGANTPWLQESFCLILEDQWDSWLEINPEDGEALGLHSGDRVWVESPHGRDLVRAHFYPGVRPGVVNVPFEFGHKAYGRWAKGRGMNPNGLMETALEHLAGVPEMNSTRVRVTKAHGVPSQRSPWSNVGEESHG
ncbi:MAG: molybdopterin-containing oxidoreductase family protein [Planctomycetota bacterium]|jgi:anaerobic selenocysteine-containing dehydrogenase